MESDEHKTPRAWQRMLSGRRLDLLNPDPADIDIVDIAHGLSRVARWNGQTVGEHAFTVAQHSLVVADICADLNPDWSVQWHRAALLHDAAEYVVGDLISPFKTAIGHDYKAFELRLLGAIHKRFDLPEKLDTNISEIIKMADQVAAYFEATVLAGFTANEAKLYFHLPQNKLSSTTVADLHNLTAYDTHTAQNRFLERFRDVA